MQLDRQFTGKRMKLFIGLAAVMPIELVSEIIIIFG